MWILCTITHGSTFWLFAAFWVRLYRTTSRVFPYLSLFGGDQLYHPTSRNVHFGVIWTCFSPDLGHLGHLGVLLVFCSSVEVLEVQIGGNGAIANVVEVLGVPNTRFGLFGPFGVLLGLSVL